MRRKENGKRCICEGFFWGGGLEFIAEGSGLTLCSSADGIKGPETIAGHGGSLKPNWTYVTPRHKRHCRSTAYKHENRAHYPVLPKEDTLRSMYRS